CGSEELIVEAAEALIEKTGVDFVVYREADCVILRSQRGDARIERDEGDRYRYLSLNGDPLELNLPNTSGFISASEWFKTTSGHRYPNAVVNIYKSLFAERVKHTADILISLHDGYYYGWSPFGKL